MNWRPSFCTFHCFLPVRKPGPYWRPQQLETSIFLIFSEKKWALKRTILWTSWLIELGSRHRVITGRRTIYWWISSHRPRGLLSRSDQSIFYIPTGLAPVGSKQHYLRYHPVSEIIPNSEFQVGPSYKSPSHGPETRELFTQSANGLKYLGLYKRFFNDSIAFTGMMLPSSMVCEDNWTHYGSHCRADILPLPARPTSLCFGRSSPLSESFFEFWFPVPRKFTRLVS